MKRFSWKWQDLIAVLIGVVTLGFALLNYNKLPDLIPSHFNLHGEVDGYSQKTTFIPMMGALGILLPLLLGITRRIDPRKNNYAKFENAYAMTKLLVAIIINFAYLSSILIGLGYPLQLSKYLFIFIGLLFVGIGNYMPQFKDNYFIGVKTPWTLNDPEVWRKTHRFAGPVWVIGGLLLASCAFLSEFWIMLFSITALACLIFLPIFYSFWISSIRRGRS